MKIHYFLLCVCLFGCAHEEKKPSSFPSKSPDILSPLKEETVSAIKDFCSDKSDDWCQNWKMRYRECRDRIVLSEDSGALDYTAQIPLIAKCMYH